MECTQYKSWCNKYVSAISVLFAAWKEWEMEPELFLMMTVSVAMSKLCVTTVDKQVETNRQADRGESEAAILMSMHKHSPWILPGIGCPVHTWAQSDTFQELRLQSWLCSAKSLVFIHLKTKTSVTCFKTTCKCRLSTFMWRYSL